MAESFRFNTDLLLKPEDRRAFEALYPKLLFAFNDDELRALFDEHDKVANDAKKGSQIWGARAVALVTAALMAASFDLMLHDPAPWRAPLALAAACAGIVGTAIGFFGVMFGAAKQRWLERRYVTERLRQLHFQTLIAWAPEIVRAAETGDTAAFLQARRARLVQFKAQHVDHVGAKLAAATSDRSDDGEAWMVAPRGEIAAFAGPQAQELLKALEQLRIGHQLDFAEWKLRADYRFFSSSPLRQAAMFSGAALVCVLLLLVAHAWPLAAYLGALAGLLSRESAETPALLHVAAMWFAILALAARTLEEGFQSQREVERYRHYASALRLVRARFGAAGAPGEKLEALRELEDVAYEEMVNFLKSNHEARFVM
jgi:hypothetical protein